MTRTELAIELSKHNDLPVSRADQAIVTLLDIIKAAVQRGERVELRGFGVFAPFTRQGGQGRNPRTGEAVNYAAQKTVKFKPGKEFKDALNGN